MKRERETRALMLKAHLDRTREKSRSRFSKILLYDLLQSFEG